MNFSQAEKDALINKVILKRYKIIKWWQDGGLSCLFDAIDLKNSKDRILIKVVKINLLDDNSDKKFFDEQKIFDSLDYTNKNIIKRIDYAIEDNYFYLIQEKFISQDLKQYINQNFPLTLDEVIYIVLQIIKGVKVLHNNKDCQIIHRDIKPQNILIDIHNNVKLIDFGISTIIQENQVYTKEEDLFCSFYYSSPDILKLNRKVRKLNTNEQMEQFSKIVTPQLDIHAIGVILYEMLTFKYPFEQFKSKTLSDKQKVELWLTYDIPTISNMRKDVPIQIDNIIYRATASKRNNIKYRYSNIIELEEELMEYQSLSNEPLWIEKYLEDKDFDNKQQNIQVAVNKYKKTRIFLYCAIAIVIVLILIAIIVYFVTK